MMGRMNPNSPVLSLDPRFPVVWRSPTELQVGVDVPLAFLDRVSGPEERMLHALARGVSFEGLRMIGGHSRGGTRSARELLERVAPALLRSGQAFESTAFSPTPLAGHAVSVVGASAVTGAVRRFLGDLGATVESAGEDQPAGVGLAVIVSSWATPPADAAAWLRRDIPHLDVVFSDAEVRVGPLVSPGGGPCLHCRERHHIDADPAWPAIAGQLRGRSAPTEVPLTIARVLPVIAEFCLHGLRSGKWGAAGPHLPMGRVVHIDTGTGGLSERVLTTHPQCACRALPENGTVREPVSDSLPSPPTRAPAVAWRG